MPIEENFKTTPGDILHGMTKAGLSSVPVIGNILSEAFSLYVTQPAEKRKENIIVLIDERLSKLEEKSFDIETLNENEMFLSVVLDSINIAMRTHLATKRVALLNAITNVALEINIDNSIADLFMSMIDELTEIHLKILYYFSDPIKNLEEKGIEYKDLYMGGADTPLYRYYPELEKDDDFVELVVKDLQQKGLLTSGSFMNTTMTQNGMLSSRTTSIGNKFINFISEPDLLK